MENIYTSKDKENRLKNLMSNLNLTDADKGILRDLAKRVAAQAGRSIEDENRKLWYAHNDLKTKEPIVFCDPENGWHEVICKDMIECNSSLARAWEFSLRKEIFWGEHS